MALIIRNEYGKYIMHNVDGTIAKTTDASEAEDFGTLENAILFCKCHVNRTKGYFVYDTVTRKICYRIFQNRQHKRKVYSEDTRKLLYNNAGGRCELCGRKILFEDMTVDHVNPISMGGSNSVENLACTCQPCNLFKGNILPELFEQRITEIFMYQMEKKWKGKFAWKAVHMVLKKMI